MNSRKPIMIIFTYQALETIEEKRKSDNKKIYWSHNIYLALHFWKKINFPSAPWTSENFLYFDILYINIF
jgi:hypothetical protein